MVFQPVLSHSLSEIPACLKISLSSEILISPLWELGIRNFNWPQHMKEWRPPPKGPVNPNVFKRRISSCLLTGFMLRILLY